ncbi:MAG: hypothetical protein IJS95_02015, partial [Prevotella sp.]|nr:hypothetical protein [Prevotella sp.]
YYHLIWLNSSAIRFSCWQSEAVSITRFIIPTKVVFFLEKKGKKRDLWKNLLRFPRFFVILQRIVRNSEICLSR